MIKTDGVNTSDGVSVNLLQIDSNGNALGWFNQYKLISTGGTHDWQRLEADVTNLNSNTVTLGIYLRIDADAGGTAWFDDVMLTGSKGIAGIQKSVQMENGTVYDKILATGTPWKSGAAYTQGCYQQLIVPDSGTVTVSATGGFKAGCTGQSAVFSIKYRDCASGATGTLQSATHSYNGSTVTVSTNLNSLAGRKIDLYLAVEAAAGGNADGAAWIAADINGL
jgi:hypothetical protein